ncbi:hypothetical protein ISCGN_009845 [Ixodes scapularis]
MAAGARFRLGFHNARGNCRLTSAVAPPTRPPRDGAPRSASVSPFRLPTKGPTTDASLGARHSDADANTLRNSGAAAALHGVTKCVGWGRGLSIVMAAGARFRLGFHNARGNCRLTSAVAPPTRPPRDGAPRSASVSPFRLPTKGPTTDASLGARHSDADANTLRNSGAAAALHGVTKCVGWGRGLSIVMAAGARFRLGFHNARGNCRLTSAVAPSTRPPRDGAPRSASVSPFRLPTKGPTTDASLGARHSDADANTLRNSGAAAALHGVTKCVGWGRGLSIVMAAGARFRLGFHNARGNCRLTSAVAPPTRPPRDGAPRSASVSPFRLPTKGPTTDASLGARHSDADANTLRNSGAAAALHGVTKCVGWGRGLSIVMAAGARFRLGFHNARGNCRLTSAVAPSTRPPRDGAPRNASVSAFRLPTKRPTTDASLGARHSDADDNTLRNSGAAAALHGVTKCVGWGRGLSIVMAAGARFRLGFHNARGNCRLTSAVAPSTRPPRDGAPRNASVSAFRLPTKRPTTDASLGARHSDADDNTLRNSGAAAALHGVTKCVGWGRGLSIVMAAGARFRLGFHNARGNCRLTSAVAPSTRPPRDGAPRNASVSAFRLPTKRPTTDASLGARHSDADDNTLRNSGAAAALHGVTKCVGWGRGLSIVMAAGARFRLGFHNARGNCRLTSAVAPSTRPPRDGAPRNASVSAFRLPTKRPTTDASLGARHSDADDNTLRNSGAAAALHGVTKCVGWGRGLSIVMAAGARFRLGFHNARGNCRLTSAVAPSTRPPRDGAPRNASVSAFRLPTKRPTTDASLGARHSDADANTLRNSGAAAALHGVTKCVGWGRGLSIVMAAGARFRLGFHNARGNCRLTSAVAPPTRPPRDGAPRNASVSAFRLPTKGPTTDASLGARHSDADANTLRNSGAAAALHGVTKCVGWGRGLSIVMAAGARFRLGFHNARGNCRLTSAVAPPTRPPRDGAPRSASVSPFRLPTKRPTTDASLGARHSDADANTLRNSGAAAALHGVTKCVGWGRGLSIVMAAGARFRLGFHNARGNCRLTSAVAPSTRPPRDGAPRNASVSPFRLPTKRPTTDASLGARHSDADANTLRNSGAAAALHGVTKCVGWGRGLSIVMAAGARFRLGFHNARGNCRLTSAVAPSTRPPRDGAPRNASVSAFRLPTKRPTTDASLGARHSDADANTLRNSGAAAALHGVTKCVGWGRGLSIVMAAGARFRLGFHNARGNCRLTSAVAPPTRPPRDGAPRNASVSAFRLPTKRPTTDASLGARHSDADANTLRNSGAAAALHGVTKCVGWGRGLSIVMAAGARFRLGFHNARGNCRLTSAVAPSTRPPRDGAPRNASVSAFRLPTKRPTTDASLGARHSDADDNTLRNSGAAAALHGVTKCVGWGRGLSIVMAAGARFRLGFHNARGNCRLTSAVAPSTRPPRDGAPRNASVSAFRLPTKRPTTDASLGARHSDADANTLRNSGAAAALHGVTKCVGWGRGLSIVMAAGARFRLGFHNARGNCRLTSAVAPSTRPPRDGAPRNASVSAFRLPTKRPTTDASLGARHSDADANTLRNSGAAAALHGVTKCVG